MRLWASAERVRFAGSEVTEANFLIRFLRRIRFSGTTGRPGLRNAYPTRDTSMTDPIRKILCIGAILVLTSIVVVATSNAKQDQPIKKSQSGICHCPGGAYYDRTKRFTPFRTIDECLSDGGRHPKRGQGDCTQAGASALNTPAAPSVEYDTRAIRPGVRVVDGDTIDVNGTRIRFQGIDTPETGQSCRDAAGPSLPTSLRHRPPLELL